MEHNELKQQCFEQLIVGIKTYRWNDRLTSTWFLPIGCAGERAGNFQGWAIKQNDNESITTIRNKMIRMIMNQ